MAACWTRATWPWWPCRPTARHNADGTELGWRRTYLEIEGPHGFVSTEVFDGCPEGEAQSTLTEQRRHEFSSAVSSG